MYKIEPDGVQYVTNSCDRLMTYLVYLSDYTSGYQTVFRGASGFAKVIFRLHGQV